jgi:hypothetical protein
VWHSNEFQGFQDNLACIVVNYLSASSASQLLYDLHWQLVHQHNDFKILNLNHPSYLFCLSWFSAACRLLRLHEYFARKAYIFYMSLERAMSLEAVPSVLPHPESGTFSLR